MSFWAILSRDLIDTRSQTLSDLAKFDPYKQFHFPECSGLLMVESWTLPALKCLSSTTCSKTQDKWPRLIGQICVGFPDTPGSHDCRDGHQHASGILASDSFHYGSSYRLCLWIVLGSSLVPVASRKTLHILWLYKHYSSEFPGAEVQWQWSYHLEAQVVYLNPSQQKITHTF